MEAGGSAPVTKEYGKSQPLRALCFLSGANDETDSPSYVAKVVLLLLLLPPPVVLLRVSVLPIPVFYGSLLIATSP